MPSLPSGTVTFLFTDIEGSTRLLQHIGDRYSALLRECQGLLRFMSPCVFGAMGACGFPSGSACGVPSAQGWNLT
jgi:class 3 adenylate cyclase